MIETPTQPQVGKIFTRLLKNNRLGSSYLFYGPAGCGKWQAAVEIAATVLANQDGQINQTALARSRKLIHPDLTVVFPMPSPKKLEERNEFVTFFRESKTANPYIPVNFGRVSNILKENVREFQVNLYKSPVEGGYRTAIFEKAETMPRTSFDILLKTIEEPPPNSLILILTDNFDRLPETIRSRCQKIRFKRTSPEFISDYLVNSKGLSREDAEFFTTLSFGSLSRAEQLVDTDFPEERETALTLLAMLFNKPLDQYWTEFQNLFNFFDKTKVENLLMIWQSLYHDISIIQSGGDNKSLINKDQEDKLVKLSNMVGSFENACNGLGNLLSLQKLFYRNINPLMAFFETSGRLKANLPPLEVRD